MPHSDVGLLSPLNPVIMDTLPPPSSPSIHRSSSHDGSLHSLSRKDSSAPPRGYAPSIPSPPTTINRSSSSPLLSRRNSSRFNSSPDRSATPQLSSQVSIRRSKLASPVFTSLREKDDPYFLALPDSSRSKILSNSAPDLNTLPHPPKVHRRPNRDSIGNGNGRFMEQLHSSRRHSAMALSSQCSSSDSRSLSRRSSIKAPFRLQRYSATSSGSSSPNYGSDSESEIFDDDHSNVGSTASTRPSSFSSTASFSETFGRSSTPDGNWKRGSLLPSRSALDFRKQDSAVLPERDHLETEECRFLESELHRFISLNPAQQTSSLRRHLLPVFSRASPLPSPSFPLLARKCTILLKYQNTLMSVLGIRPPLPQQERNTFLEAIASICERREWRDYARGMYDETNFTDAAADIAGLKGMVAAMERFREHERMSYQCVAIAMEDLSKKNFSSTAVEYCGRVLAVAFFCSPGVALRLVHALNVATPFTARLLDEVCEDTIYRDLSNHTPSNRSLFPKHLHDLIYSTPQRYTSLLMTRPSPTITIDSSLTISFAGEWVHRWRAHNSDVFFCFLKHWHVLLSEHLQSATAELTIATIAAAPGYLVMQGHILRMLDSFIHRSSNELPRHPLPAPHHNTLTKSTLRRRAFERFPNGPLGPPIPIAVLPGTRMQDSIHAMALLMDSGDGRPQGIEKAEKKLAKAVSGVLSAVRKAQGSKPMFPIRPGLVQTSGTESEDTAVTSSPNLSEGDVSTPRTVSTSDISSLVSSGKSVHSDRRISLPSLHLKEHLITLFTLLFERTLKAAVRKTSVWEGQACFALCDLIERLVPVIDDSFAKVHDSLMVLDWPFWNDVVKRMVLQSENSVTQVRAFGFLFNMWARCPAGDGEWLLEEDTWETFFCHWSTLVRCYFMNLVCWRVCMSSQSGVSVDPYNPIEGVSNSRTTVLLLKKRLEVLQRRNTILVRHAQKEGLPIPILKASNPLPNRRLIVIPSNPSYHEYGLTFDSIVPASPSSLSQIEQQVIEVTTMKPGSRGSISTLNSETSTVTGKEEKKGFKLNIFKGVFGKSGKKSKPLTPSPSTTSIPITISHSEPCPVPKPARNNTNDPPPRLPRFQSIRPRSESFQFSMQPVYTRFDTNKGIKERPTPSARAVEKFINAGPVSLPRYARDLIRSQPPLQLQLEPTDDNTRWRYAGRALAEWELVVKQCDTYVDSILRKRESIPEEEGEEQGEQEALFIGNQSSSGGARSPSSASSIPSSPTAMSCTPRHVIENMHIPRMTVELPKFYFTGKSNREG